MGIIGEDLADIWRLLRWPKRTWGDVLGWNVKTFPARTTLTTTELTADNDHPSTPQQLHKEFHRSDGWLSTYGRCVL